MRRTCKRIWIRCEIQGCLVILTTALILLASIGTARAGSCMDAKLSCSSSYFFNDTKSMIVKAATMTFSALILPSVKTTVECKQVANDTTDLNCYTTSFNSNTYIIKLATPGRIKNPGEYTYRNPEFCERLCTSLGIAVYYLNGKPL